MKICVYALLFCIACFGNSHLYAQGNDSVDIANLYSDLPYFVDRELSQDIYFTALSSERSINISLRLYHLDGRDSTIIYSVAGEGFEAVSGANKLTLPFKDRRVKTNIKQDWLSAYRSMSRVPAGDYSCHIEISNNGNAYTQRILFRSDTLITRYNKLDGGLGRLLGNNAIKLSKALDNKGPALQRYYQKKGITCRHTTQGNKEQLDLYYGHWYLGRKELPSDATAAQYAQSQEAHKNNLNETGKDALDNSRTLLSRFRDLRDAGKENTELTADISLSGNFANGQEPNSGLANNYYESRVDIDMPLFDIPVQVSGFYTTQDMHRQAKASYIHFRYDAEKAKEQLLRLISGFNDKYAQAQAKGSAYDLIYGQYIDKLQQEKDNTLNALTREYGLSPDGLSEETLKQAATAKAKEQEKKLTDSLTNKADSAGIATTLTQKKNKAIATKQQATEKYQKALEQYKKLQELQQKIDKYKTLLDQYRKTSFYDSAMAYGKLKDLQGYEDMSYKDMAKKATSLLPESKTKSALTGLVSFDAGMFPKYVSDYTMSGQMLKGLDMSYDIGIATIGGSYGKMEYTDRNGNIEGYKAYSGRVQFKPIKKQTLGLVYYGYSPGKDLVNGDGFFKDISVSMPSFRNPVNILSATYSGNITQYLNLSGEYAFSDKPAQSDQAKEQAKFTDRSAYNLKALAQVPGTTIEIETGYEHAGKTFENNTLPLLLAGTDKLSAKVKGDFLRSFLTLGAEYNYLIQKSFYSKGSNSRWGFDIATHSKRYPSLALSYKPFSTFRSYNDTLSIAQKPISGEVWTGKANYQIKRLDKAIRFTLIYSRNSSANDTIRYKSATTQFSTILTRKATMLMVNIGQSSIDAGAYETAYPMYNNSWFAGATLSGAIKEQIQLSGGIDLTKAGPGISKYGCYASSGYTFKKLPIGIRASCRYNNYRMAERSSRQQLISGGIELSWRIREKIYTD